MKTQIEKDIHIDATETRKIPKQVTAEMVPLGTELNAVRLRQSLIRQYYSWWVAQHPDKKVRNKALGEDIFVSYGSKQETSRQAAYRYESTLAVLRLDYILANALPILSSPADHNTKAQRRYGRILLMKCDCDGLGLVKLTVGVNGKTQQKEQYCITVTDLEFAEAFRQSSKHQVIVGQQVGKCKKRTGKKPVRK